MNGKDIKGQGAHPEKIRTERAQFRLQGRSVNLDKRIHAVRGDLADVSLAGTLFSAHYARAVPMSCVTPGCTVFSGGSRNSEAVSQLLRGEIFHVLDVTAEWAWGFCGHDSYVGYVRRESLDVREAATHRITARLAPIFAEPDIKSPIRDYWPTGAQFAATTEGDFLNCPEGYIHNRHAVTIETRDADWVGVAEQYVGMPYVWGGRGQGGVDCSGLVQVALGTSGRKVPRDTDLQRDSIGEELADDAPLQRGDIIFFPGHVGIMIDAANLLHANAHWMTTMIEPLSDAIDRLKPQHDRPVLARRRIAVGNAA